MDNDNKVAKSSLHDQVMLFLDDEVSRLPTDVFRSSYNLENEYAKTKKNHSVFTIHALFIAFVVVLVTVLSLTKIISDIDKKVTVELSEFSDLNLKTLLDSVSKIQENYDEAVKEKYTLIADRDSALKSAELKRDQDIFVVKSLHLSNKSDEKRRISKVTKDFEDTVAKINAEYEPKIEAVTSKIEDLDVQLKTYDSAKVEAAQQQDRILNSERQVQELEKRRITEQYEQRISELQRTIDNLRSSNNEDMFRSIQALTEKYQAEIDSLDPVIHDVKADAVIADSKMSEWNDFNTEVLLEENDLIDNSIVDAFNSYQKSYDEYFYLNKSVANIPHKNTIPSYVEASNVFVNNMSKTFKNTTLALQSENNELYEKVGELESDINNLKNKNAKLEDDVDDLNLEIDDLNTEISNLEINKNMIEDCLVNLLATFKYGAVVISAETKDNVRMMLAPVLLEVLEEDSVINVDIKAGKSIKGTLVQDEGNYFLFEPAVDKQGVPIDFNLELLTPGTPAKVTVKK